MKSYENVDTEFRELDRNRGTLPESMAKEICAFANTEGGIIYLGIRDDGSIAGVDKPDDIMTRVSNVAHDTILPDIIPFLQIRTIEIEGKPVIKVTVSVGTERPYYLAKEGLKPKGVFVRRGSACIPVNEAGIREMIMETSGKSFEESRSLNQDLTFYTMTEQMDLHHLEFGIQQMINLKLKGSDGLYTNLGLLLSDQCPFTIKVAIFQDDDATVFRDRKEFSGSILKQLSEVYKFLDFYNKTSGKIEGLYRKDVRDYPEDAVREALVNCIVHRDYLFSGSTIINLYSGHMEFVSLGGLVRGLTMKAVFMGASQSRNPNLASVFYRLHLVESYGTGIKKIKKLYGESGLSPVFETAEGAFEVILQNCNENAQKINSESHNVVPDTIGCVVNTTKKHQFRTTEEQKEALYQFIVSHGNVTRKEAEEFLDAGTTKAYTMLKSLCEEGLISQKKLGNRTYYTNENGPGGSL